MKKLFSLLSILFFMIFTGCISMGGFPVIDDTIKSSNKYKAMEFYSGVVYEDTFNQYKKIARNSIVENKDLKDSQKKQMLKELDDLQYKENQYLYFTLCNNAPLLDDELEIKFQIINSENKNLYNGSTMASVYWYQYGAIVSCNYTYLVFADRPLDSETKKAPVKFVILMPDNSKRIYEVSI